MAAPRNQSSQKDHRARLRKRFAADDGASMPDYELLELILFSAIPRRDTKPLAKSLIERFGSLAGVLAADYSDITQVAGAWPGVAGLLKTGHQAGIRQAREDLHERQILNS
jgi:DNA repair protein RadC